MLGALDAEQIERLLHSATVGRIDAHADGRTYVVPVTHVYDGDAVYAHSAAGLKIRMMRSTPDVCFEVDEIDDLSSWRSVIAWGRNAELVGDLATAAMNLLRSRLAPIAASETAGPAGHPVGAAGAVGIAFRVRLSERTGRFEKR
jgi:uncharacterized protein